MKKAYNPVNETVESNCDDRGCSFFDEHFELNCSYSNDNSKCIKNEYAITPGRGDPHMHPKSITVTREEFNELQATLNRLVIAADSIMRERSDMVNKITKLEAERDHLSAVIIEELPDHVYSKKFIPDGWAHDETTCTFCLCAKELEQKGREKFCRSTDIEILELKIAALKDENEKLAQHLQIAYDTIIEMQNSPSVNQMNRTEQLLKDVASRKQREAKP